MAGPGSIIANSFVPKRYVFVPQKVIGDGFGAIIRFKFG
jgi:hypothetical protein